MGRKDSLRNAEASGAFSWNLATWALAEKMNASSAGVDPQTDEFALAGLTAVAATVVDAPRVAESQVSFECLTTQCIQLQDAKGQAQDCWLLLGEVVGVHIDEALLVDGIYQTAAAKPIMRGGGPVDYFSIDETAKFEMRRPVNAGL